MKKLFLFTLFPAFSIFNSYGQQLADGGFETWVYSAKYKLTIVEGWEYSITCQGEGSNEVCHSTNERISDAHTGSYAMKNTAIKGSSVHIGPSWGIFEDFFTDGKAPVKISFWYKSSTGNTKIKADAEAYNGIIFNPTTVATGSVNNLPDATSFTKGEIILSQVKNIAPQHLTISFEFADINKLKGGEYFIIDDITLEYSSVNGIEDDLNNISEIKFQNNILELPLGSENVSVSNLEGKEMEKLQNEVSVDFSSYPAGIYLVRIQNGDKVQQMKIFKN